MFENFEIIKKKSRIVYINSAVIYKNASILRFQRIYKYKYLGQNYQHTR